MKNKKKLINFYQKLICSLVLYALTSLNLYFCITIQKINSTSNQKIPQKSVSALENQPQKLKKMQPRILIRQEGQNKKRFISPTQVKNNQAIYGDPLGGPKGFANGQLTGTNFDRIYSPDGRKSVAELQKHQSQKSIGVKAQNSQRLSEGEKMRSIGQNPKPQIQIQNAKSTSRSKLAPQITKKDYMTSTLAKLNRHKTRQSDEQSNGSQSRSKINSIRNEKPKNKEDEYPKNVYNQKQKDIKRRTRNNDSQSQASDAESEEGMRLGYEARIEKERNSVKTKIPQNSETKNIGYSEQPMSPTVRPNMNAQKMAVQQVVSPPKVAKHSQQTQKPLSRQSQQKTNFQESLNFQKPQAQLQPLKRPSNQQSRQTQNPPLQSPRSAQYATSHSQHQNPQKISVTSVQESRNFDQVRSQIQDSNNSSLVVHLKKAHEEKDELIQKKIQAEKQRNELKQKVQSHQQLLIQLRTQLEHSHVQNMSLNSELKAIKQTQTRTKTEMQGTNERNEHVYRQIHEKYQLLVEDHRKAIMENDGLRQQCERLRAQNLNYEKKVGFMDGRIKQFEGEREEREREWKKELKRTTDEWRTNVEKLQKELRKYEMQDGESMNGNGYAQIKAKLMECETELFQQISFVKAKEEEGKSLKRELFLKSQELEQILIKKDKEIMDLSQEIQNLQKKSAQKFNEYEIRAKQLQLNVVKVEKQLNLKRMQVKELKQTASVKPSEKSLANIYSESLPETQQARLSLESIVSSQTESINSYKKQLNKSITENFTLKSEIQELRSMNNSIKQDMGILQMQYAALEKKITQSKDADMYLIKSQLEAAQRRQKQLQQKLQVKVKEVKEKDDFIQAQLMRPHRA